MLTIRHIEDNGYESIRECSVLWRETEPTGGDIRDCGCPPGAVGQCRNAPCPRKSFDGPMVAQHQDGTISRYGTGELFVMNDHGRTVARYEWRTVASNT